MRDPLVPNTFELLYGETDSLIGRVKFLGAASHTPREFEPRKALYLVAIHSIATLVGTSVGSVLDLGSRHGLSYNFGYLADTVVVLIPANIERLVMNQFEWCFKDGQESTGDVFDMDNRSPGGAVALNEYPP